MNFLPVWKRKSDTRRSRLRHSSSELAIEFAEPRLLLSVSLGVNAAAQTAAASAITAAIQGNLDNLGHVLGGVEQAAAGFQHALPLITGVAGAPVTLANLTDALSTTHDKLFDLDAKFHDSVVTPLLGLTDFSAIHDTGALATALENALKTISGNQNVTVTDHSTSKLVHDPSDTSHPASLTLAVVDNAIFDFGVTLPALSTSFALSFNGLADSGLALPVVKGTFGITEALTFETKYDVSGAAFTLPSAVATTNFSASATIPAHFQLGFGLLSLESSGAALSYAGTITATFVALDAATLTTDGQDTTHGYVSGVAAVLDTDHSLSLVVPLDLSQELLQIPGFTNVSGNLTATGSVFGDNWHFGFNGFDSLKNLADMSPSDLLGIFSTVDSYFNQLTQSSLLNLELPLTNGATIGDVINFAKEFKADVIDKLAGVGTTIGIDYSHQSAAAADGTQTALVEIAPPDLSHNPLPESFRIEIAVNGHILDLDITNPFHDPANGNALTRITTIDQLEAAIAASLHDALAAAGLSAGLVTVGLSADHKKIDFTAQPTQNTTDAGNPASISIHTPGVSFVSLVTFAENLASVLGYGDVVSSAITLHDLFAGIGIHFDPGTGAGGTLEFQLNYSAHLPAGLASLGFDGSHRTGVDSGAQVQVAATLPSGADFTGAFAFNIVVNGHNVEIDLAADPSRTTADLLTSAINTALQTTLVVPNDLNLSGNNAVALSTLITVSDPTVGSDKVLTFSATKTALTPSNPVAATALLALSDVHGLSFSTGFDLGALGSLALTNALFSLDATAGASMTLGIKIPSATSGSVTSTTPLDSLPVWPSGAVTADQLNDPTMVVRADLGLGSISNGLSSTDVQPLSDLIVASVNGSTLVLTATGIAPVSGQLATIVLQDAGATGSQLGLSALGFAVGQAGADDGTHNVFTLGAASAATDFTKEYVFNIVINGHAVKVDVGQDLTRTSASLLADAINHALGSKAGLADMKIYLRDGTVGTIEFQSSKTAGVTEHLVVGKPDGTLVTIAGTGTGADLGKITLGDLISAFNDIGVSASYDATSQTLKIIDGTTSHYLTPETLGFAANQSAIATKLPPAHPNDDPSTLEYQAVLTANPANVLAQITAPGQTPPAAPDFTQANAFLITIGTLDPVEVTIGPGPARHNADDYAAAINLALSQVFFSNAQLGLTGTGQVALSTLIHADALSDHKTLTLTLTMSHATGISVTSNDSNLRAEAKFGFSISAVDTLIWSTNGSHVAGALGIAGFDKFGLFSNTQFDNTTHQRLQIATGEIDSTPLQGGTLADRIFVENASLFAGLHLHIEGDLAGTLGFLGFSAHASGDINLKTSLSLQNPAGASSVTFQEISNAFTTGSVADLWAFSIGAGVPGQPWAALTISSINLAGAGAISGLASAIAGGGHIDIVLDSDLSSLGDFLNTRPVVTYTGFDLPDLQNLSFAKIVSGIQTVLKLLDNTAGTSVLTTPIPLIGVDLESVLHFADNIAGFVDQLEKQPAAAIDQVSQAIQKALGTTAVSLSIDSNHNLLLNFNIQPLAVSESLPVTLDLKALAASAGVSLPDGVADLASASGTLAITAGATFGISLGIRLAATPATTSSLLSSLNKGAGVAGDGTSAPDIGFVLGNGVTFNVDIDNLGTNPTVATLLTAINSAATGAGFGGTFASFAGGQFVFADTTTVVGAVSNGLSDLGFDLTHRAATQFGSTLTIDAAIAPAHLGAEFAFKLLINGHAITVDVPADAARTDAAGLVSAINSALHNLSVDRASLDLTGSGQVALDHLVVASVVGGKLQLDAHIADIASTLGPSSLALRDLAPAGLSALGIASPATASDSGTISTVTATLPGAIDYGQGYRFDVVINTHTVTVEVAENGARTTAAALTAAINAALGNALVDRGTFGLSGNGSVSVGQLVTASLAGTTLTFTASDSKLGTTHSFGLRNSVAVPQKLAFEVVDLNNSGGAAALGLGTTGAILGLHTLGPAVSGGAGGSLTVTLTPPDGTDFTKAFAFDLVIDGHPITLSIGADASRTDINAMAKALNTALGKLSADRAEFGLNGTGITTFDKILTVTSDATHIVLTAKAADLAPIAANATLALKDVVVTATMDVAASGTGRTVTGNVLDIQADDDRFFVNTNAPDASVDPGSGIVVTVGVAATDLTFNTSFGPLSASIQGGTATLGIGTDGHGNVVGAQDGNGNLNPDFTVGTPARVNVGLAGDTNHQLSFTAIANAIHGSTVSSLIAVDTNVAISVDLPVFLVGISIGDVIVKVSDILGTNNLAAHTGTFVDLPTDFASHFSAFNFLNNPQAVINGLDALLSTTDSLFQAQVFGFKLPLIGDALASAGDFVGDLRANVIGYLQGLVNDYEALHPGQEPTTASIISDGMSQLLTSLGFHVAPGATDLVTSSVNPGAETVTFNLDIEKLLFHGSIDMSADLGIPGLGIAIQNGKINLDLTLDINLQFGYAAIGDHKGFFFNDTLADAHALALTFTASLPASAALTANVGIISMTATNSIASPFSNGQHGTALLGGVFVDLHPKATADLSDLGFTKATIGETVTGTDHVVMAGNAFALTNNPEVIFNISVNGTDFKIDVPAGTDAAHLVQAIEAKMAAIHVDKSLIGQTGGGTVTLDTIVTVSSVVDSAGSHLKFESTDAKLGAHGHLAVDDVPLSTTDVPRSLRVDLQAQADLDLALSAAISLGSIQLPSVSAELVFEYKFAKLLSGFDDGTFVNGVTQAIEFKDVTLDVGPFLSGFLKPILDVAWDIIGPIMPVLDFITSPLPGISDLLGSPTSLIDLAQLLGGENPEVRSLIAAVQMIDEVANLIQSIENMSHETQVNGRTTILIDFGTYVFAASGSDPNAHYLGSNVDPFSGSVKNTHISSSLGNVSSTPSQSSGSAADNDAAAALGQLGALGQSTQGNGKLSLPILENPIGALKLLTGQLDGIDLFTWELPTFIVGLSGGKTFPVVGIPGIGIEAGLSINFSVGLHVKFGYDTTGFVEFLHSNNPVFLLDGFYVDDTVGPQLTAHFGIAATAALDLFLVKAGVTGEIDGDFSFTLLDPNDDGRVRPVEILDTLLHDPLHIFVIDGQITASVSAWWWVGIDTFLFGTITLYDGSKTLISGTLVSFHYAPTPDPILATLDTSNTLNIDMGPLANQRAHAGDNVDGNESFEIDHSGGSAGDESVQVTYHYANGTDYVRSYDHVKSINVDGGVGNNTIVLKNVLSDMTVNGGDGNNVVDLTGSSGKATVTLGNGNNTITGGLGDPNSPNVLDTITVGDGNNIITGSDGKDVILAGAGANFINGAGGGDTITAGSGRNVLIGGSGNNSIKAGDGADIVFGGNADAATLNALKTMPAFSTLTSLSTDSGATDGNNTIRLGGGNNIVFGGAGGDIITAGSGDNVVLADLGTVKLQNGVLITAATVDASGTLLTLGGNDRVTLGVGTALNTLTGQTAPAGTGNQIILGGGGDDVLLGTNGTNIILGDFGSVDGAAGGTGSAFTVTSLTPSNGTVGGSDTLTSGVGNDVLIGGPGVDTINAGPGNDIVAGDDAQVVRDAAIGPGAKLVSFESLDETFGGLVAGSDVTLDGSTGNDLVIGGGGGDNIIGGSGNNTLLGDFGRIVPAAANGSVADVIGRSTGSADNGSDTISATNGYNVIMGGGGNDTINAGDGTNVVFGDNGSVMRSIDTHGNLIPVEAEVVDQSSGGNDTITSGRGSNIVIGGAGDDQLTAGGGSNVLLGDFGTYRTPDGSNPDVVGTDTSNAFSGHDTIQIFGGNNVAMGGGNDDIITAEKPAALYDLGFDLTHRTGVDNGTAFVITATLPALTGDALKAFVATRYTFDVVINGHDYLIDVGSDVGRTAYADLVDAINTALSKTTPLKSDLGLPGSGTVKLSDFVTAATDGTQMTFTAQDSTLAPVSGTPALALRDAPSVNILFGDSGSVVRQASPSLALVSAQTAEESFGGDDQITLNYGANVAFGGAGSDTIIVHGIGANIALGDNGSATTATLTTPDTVTGRNTGAGGADTITIATDATGDNIVVGGVGGDTIVIDGSGNNVSLGDSGQVKRTAGTLAFVSAQTLDDAQTLDETVGGDDSITVGVTANGNNVLIGGAGTDTLTVMGTGKNIVLGDVGSVSAATATDPDIVAAHNLSIGAADAITVASSASGANILIGGAGSDHITINGAGGNIAFGDGGIVKRAAVTLALISADAVEEATGGNDTILVDGSGGNLGNGNNILIGGAGGDSITIKGDGKNIALGDIGSVTAATANTPDIVAARDTIIGGVDTIAITADAAGNNIVMGGALAETITVDGSGDNVIFGDSGLVLRAAGTLAFISAETVEEAIGGADSITINGGGKNIVLGGADSDAITIAGTGNNIALGDMGLVHAIDGVNPDVVGRDTAIGAPDTFILAASASGNNIIMGETGDENIVSDATGFNIFFGDTGSVTRSLTGDLVNVASADPTLGGADTITTHAGSSIVIGGAKDDTIRTADGTDYIVGDNGAFTFLNGVRSELKSTNFTVAGNDTINAGGGENYVIGGGGNDLITGNAGNDIVIGDQGDITWDGAGVLQKMSSLFDVNATEGVDTIDVGDGNNSVIGGGKGDSITAGSGTDYIVGDNGFIAFSSGIITQISSADPAIAGNDTINAGDGTNYLIGGGGNDSITGGAGTDYIIGDNGSIALVAGVRNLMTSADFTVAGNDTINTGEGENYAIGGGGDDIITGGAGRDQLIGDQGFVSWNSDGTRHEVSSLFDAAGTAGADTIHGGGGNDNIIGGLNADDVYGDDGNDIVFGDDGHVLFLNDQEIMAETLDQHTGTGDLIHGGAGNNFLFGGEKNNLFFADPLQDLIVIMDGHVDISADRKVTINIPPFFGDPMLSPLGKSLQNPPAGDGVTQQPSFAVIKTGGETDGLTALFGSGDGQDGASQIISTLSGQPQSAFNLHGLLSGNVIGSSLLNLLAIGPTSLIEAVTIGDVLDSQQDTSTDAPQAADDHDVVDGVLAQGGEGGDTPDAALYHRPTIVEAPADPGLDFASVVEPAAAAMVYDEERGLWIPDVAAGPGPRLILNGADLPTLDLSSEMTMAA